MTKNLKQLYATSAMSPYQATAKAEATNIHRKKEKKH